MVDLGYQTLTKLRLQSVKAKKMWEYSFDVQKEIDNEVNSNYAT